MEIEALNETGDFQFEDIFDQYKDDEDDLDIDEELLPEPKNLPLNKRNFEDFEILKQIGEGGYGKVYQVRMKENSCIYALKLLKKGHLMKTNSVGNTRTERDIMTKVDHPFIIKLRYAFQTDDRVGFVMDYINGGQLFHHMNKESIFSEAQARFYIAELILAVSHLHRLGIIHRDLKPENILVDSEGHVLLTDFGLAKEDIDDENKRTNTFCGTLEYMSPEMIKKELYGTPTDYWSIGILLYDMVVGKTPFRCANKKKMQNQIISGKVKFPNYLMPNVMNLVKGLTEKEPEKRLKMKQIKSHPFFKGLDWKKLEAREIEPPIVPIIGEQGLLDVSNFDEEYTNRLATISPAEKLSESQDILFQGFSYNGVDIK